MHRAEISNWTDVVFGVLPSQPNVSTDPYLLTLLRSILVDLYLQGSNLTLTNATFGHPFSFNILKLQGGITLIPDKLAPPIGQIPEILFNFTLNNSIDEIRENFMALNRQLRLGLHLMPDEVQIYFLFNFVLCGCLFLCLWILDTWNTAFRSS